MLFWWVFNAFIIYHFRSLTFKRFINNKDEFYDLKFIQNSTANDLNDDLKHLNLSNHESTVISSDNFKRKKNLHVTFKDEIENVSTYSYYDNMLPNPLKHLNFQNCTNTDQYSLKTPPITNNLDYSFHETPYVYNKFNKSDKSNKNSCNDNSSNIKKKLTFDSNMSSPTWHHHSNLFSFSNSIDNNSSHKNKSNDINELERLEKCFGSLDTSPIKPLCISYFYKFIIFR